MPEGLAAHVSAQTNDFRRGMQVAQSSLSDVRTAAATTALALGRTAEQMDDARNSALAMAASAATASASFNFLGVSLSGTAASLSATAAAATALATTLVPLTATVGGLATAATALAGAFGAVVGSGALAYGEQLNTQYQQQLLRVQDQIEAIEQLREEQGSLTDQQRRRLRQLEQEEQRLDDAEGAVSALQVRLGELGDTLAQIIAAWGAGFAPLVRDAINAVPTLVRRILDAVGSAQQFATALRNFGRAAMSVIPGIAGSFADLARQSLPVLVDMMQWFRANGGSIFDGLLRTTREVGPLLQDVGSAFVSALPAINRVGVAVLQQLLPALAGGIRGFGNLLERVLAFSKTERFTRIMTAVRDVIAELGPEINRLQQNFGVLFDRIIKNGPAIIRGFGVLIDGVLDIVNAAMPVLQFFIDVLGTVGEAFTQFQTQTQRLEQRAAQSEEQRRRVALSQLSPAAFEGGYHSRPSGRAVGDIRIRVEGDTDVIRDVAVEEYDRREYETYREQRRLGGG